MQASSDMEPRLRRKLVEAFAPEALVITDNSNRHRGHAGYREGGGTHFDVRIVSTAFEGLSHIERQRRVHAVLRDELAERVHALSLDIKAPAEADGHEA